MSGYKLQNVIQEYNGRKVLLKCNNTQSPFVGTVKDGPRPLKSTGQHLLNSTGRHDP